MRDDALGFFWEDLPTKRKHGEYARPIPPVPETGWSAPTEFPRLADTKFLALDCETKDVDLVTKGPGFRRSDESHAHIVGISVGTQDGGRWYFPMRHTIAPEQNMNPESVLAWARDNICTPGQTKLGANLGYDVDALWSEGVPVSGPFIDIQYAEALIDENRRTYALEKVGQSYLGEGKVSQGLKEWVIRAYGDEENYRANIWRAPPCLVGPYAEGDVDLPLRIYEHQKLLLEQQGLTNLFEIETALLPQLVRMRQRGVKIDLAYAKQLDDELTAALVIADARLTAIAGRKIDVNLRDDLKRLFDAAGVHYPTTTPPNGGKGVPSFAKEFLDHCEHPAAQLITERRKLAKYRDTFVRGYVLGLHINERLHALFHPLKGDSNGTVSGRFSCVSEDVPIQTLTGVKLAKDIKRGDYLWTHKNRWRPVTHLWRKGVDAMYDVGLSNGKTLRCTDQHRVLNSVGEWVSIGEINDYLYIARAPLATTSGIETVYISEINPCGRYEVYDFTVREDESYLSQGVFSHNSSLPNLQNIPIRDPVWGPKLRALFIPEDGEIWGRHDWSQIEYRFLAHYARGRGADEVRERYRSDPSTDFHDMTMNLIRDVTGVTLDRKPVKNINFGLCIAAGQRVLTKRGLVAIENVQLTDQLWDGVEWVNHRGVIFNGYKTVIQYHGLTATPEHLVWTLGGLQMCLGDAAKIKAPINLTGVPLETLLKAPEAVFDIIDAGPRNRFTCEGVLVHNCYGMGKPKLTRDLGLDKQAGDQLFNAYHSGVPFVKDTYDAAQNVASTRGYIMTVLGRRARFHLWEPMFGEGPAMLEDAARKKYGDRIRRAFTHKTLNRLLQGSAADLMKKAMVEIDRSGVESVLGPMLLTCHDETGHSTPRTKEGKDALDEVQRIMETCMKLRVPVKAEQSTGDNWAACT